MSTETVTLFSSSQNKTPGDVPGWELVGPRRELAPQRRQTEGSGRNGGIALGMFGEYKVCVYGGWRRTLTGVRGGQHYRLNAYCTSRGVVDTRRSLYAALTWNDAAGKALRATDYAYIPPADGSDGDWSRVDYTTLAPEGAASVTVEVGMRWAAVGEVWFDDVQLTPVAPPPARTVKVASAFIDMKPGETKSAAESIERFVKLVDEKLPKGTDILCLPEGISVVGTGKPFLDVGESIPGGPSGEILSALAKRHRCYVVAGLYERSTANLFNTAVLYDRDGKFVGKYQKTHLPREEGEAGILPGDTYPVFDTDFGKIGIMVCWDVQFPEPARALALQGAELILLPIWGGNEILTKARAIENHVFLVTSSYHMKNMIIDPAGNVLAEAPGHSAGLISADVQLGKQIFQPWLGDMKNRTWIERRGDIATRIADIARSRDVTPRGDQQFIPYTLTQGHPRAYVNKAELPALRQRARTTHKDQLDSLLAFYKEKATLPGGGNDYAEPVSKLALLYLLTGEKAHAQACVRAVEKLLQVDVEGTYFPTQRRVRALGLAYDWVHDQMSESFRERIAKGIEAYVQAATDSGEAPVEGGYLAGHIANMIPHFLAAGIAIGDEGNGRALITRCLRWTERFLANSKFFLEQDSYQQSYPYTCAYVAEIASIFRLLEAGLGQTPHKEHPWFQNTIKWWIYPFRSDTTFMRFGDYFCSLPVLANGSYYRPIAYIAERYKDPVARWFAEQFKLTNDEFHTLMFPSSGPDSPPAKSPDHMPRTHLHGEMGIAVARGDWNFTSGEHAGGTVAAFKCSPHYLHNHCHRDANSIVVYHKGDLALDSGIYDDYESPHWYNYYIRTIAHNAIVIYDPNERFISRGKEYANDGGQRFINEPHWGPGDYKQFLEGHFQDGTILDYREAADHSYVCGDASNCYSKSKLNRFLRHVTFVMDWPHKGAVSLLVLDEIEVAREGLTPKFLLHSINEPQAAGSTVTITQGQGRLTATFLEPQATAIEKIGGPGKEWSVNGTNYAPMHFPKGPHTPGAWRIEAAPAGKQGKSVRFLTMLNPSDASAAVPPAPQVEKTAEGYIVRQGGLTVALYRNTPPANLTGDRKLLVKLAGA